MTHSLRKILALILCLCMCLSFVPAAWAEGEAEEEFETPEFIFEGESEEEFSFEEPAFGEEPVVEEPAEEEPAEEEPAFIEEEEPAEEEPAEEPAEEEPAEEPAEEEPAEEPAEEEPAEEPAEEEPAEEPAEEEPAFSEEPAGEEPAEEEPAFSEEPAEEEPAEEPAFSEEPAEEEPAEEPAFSEEPAEEPAEEEPAESVEAPAISTENPERIESEYTITITAQPKDAKAAEGAVEFSLAAAVSPEAEIAYRWQRVDESVEAVVWEDVENGNGPVLRLAVPDDSALAQAAKYAYRCVLTAGDCTLYSAVVRVLAFSAVEDESYDADSYSGYWGNLRWSLSGTGLLSITGSGAMDNFENTGDTSAWRNYLGSIKTVSIGSGITSTGWAAFAGCGNLTSVTLPNTLETIGGLSFFECSSLKSVNIPASVTKINYCAFNLCSSLTSVTIPGSVGSVGVGMFSCCVNLREILVDASSGWLTSVNGVLFANDTILLCYPAGKTAASYTVPSSTDTIVSYAFEGCANLTGVTIPDSVTSIGEWAFSSCAGLRSVRLSTTLTEISKGAFESCSSLQNVTIPASVTTIGASAFYNCTSLTKATLTTNVTSVGESAFRYCSALTDVIYNYGTEAQRNAITIGSNNAPLKDAVWHYMKKLGTPAVQSATPVNGGIQVKWGAVSGAAKYRVYRKYGSNSWAALVNVAATGYTDRNVTSGTTYTYTVRCLNSAGDTVSSFDTAGKSTPYLSAPGSLRAEVPESGGIVFRWGAVSGAAKYRVYRKYGSTSWTALGDTTATRYTDTRVTRGTTYTYTVRCLNSAGTAVSGYNATGVSIEYNAWLATPTPYATATGNGIQVSWSVVSGAAKYRVYRKYGSTGWAVLAETPSNSFLDTRVTAGTTYTYTVRCLNSAGATVSGFADPGASAVFRSAKLAAPHLREASAIVGVVQLKWDGVTGAAKYRVYRKVDGGGWQALANTASTAYTDRSVSAGKVYTYTVRCLNASGSPVSDYDTKGLSVSIKLATPSLSSAEASADGSGIVVRWSAVTGAAKYRVYRKYGSVSWKAIAATAATSYTDTAVAAGTTYTYTVRCLSADGKTNVSDYDTTGVSAAIPSGGKSGMWGNLSWSLSSAGRLTISGSGTMDDFTNDKDTSAWRAYLGSIKSVSIGSGVTSTGWCAFAGCANLTSVTIPNTVTYLGGLSFYQCSSLTSVTIPAGVTNMSRGVFGACSNLKEIRVDSANTALKSVNGVLFTKSGALLISYPAGKTNTGYTIPSGVETIFADAFHGCTNLTSVSIPSGVLEIRMCAFDGCTKLTSVNIPGTVTGIDNWAFSGCSSLRSVSIPASVKTIGNGAFDLCSSLASVTIQNGATSIGDWAFDYCTGLTSISIPASVKTIGNDAFLGCANLQSVSLTSGLTGLGDGVFNDCTSLRSLSLPDTVTSLGKWALEDCSSLQSVKLSTSLTSIAYGTFMNCSSLQSVSIPGSVTSIDTAAFLGCGSMRSVSIPNSVKTISNGAFLMCGSLQSVIVPHSVTSLGNNAFAFCESLKTVSLSSKLRKIDDYTFYFCTNLSNITIPSGVTSLGEGAFYGCHNLSNITIPGSVTSLGNGVFYDCCSLSSLVIPSSIRKIPYAAFAYCSNLASVTIPSSVTNVDQGAFFSCTGLSVVHYSGTRAQWNAISILSDNESLTNAELLLAGQVMKPKLTGAVYANNAVTVRWNAVSGAAKYRVFRKTAGGSWTKLGDIGGAAYTDRSVKSGTTYYYTVLCLNSSGGAISDYDHAGVSVKTAANQLAAPSLFKLDGDGASNTLYWYQVNGAASYRVYRKTGGSGWQAIATVGRYDPTFAVYTDLNVASGTTYTYTVLCLDSSGKAVSDYDHTGLSRTVPSPLTPPAPQPEF